MNGSRKEVPKFWEIFCRKKDKEKQRKTKKKKEKQRKTKKKRKQQKKQRKQQKKQRKTKNNKGKRRKKENNNKKTKKNKEQQRKTKKKLYCPEDFAYRGSEQALHTFQYYNERLLDCKHWSRVTAVLKISYSFKRLYFIKRLRHITPIFTETLTLSFFYRIFIENSHS